MSELWRKLGRDLWTLRWQVASIAAVVACGVAMLVASLGTFQSLQRARAAFYAQTSFADAFVRLTRAPDAIADELAGVDGVAGVETRLAFDAPLRVEGVPAPLSARVLSLPPAGRSVVQRLILETGRLPEPDARHEAVVNEAFAKARRLVPGDRIVAVLDGRRQEVVIVGTVLSAEHLAALRPGDVLPDDAHFAILWLPHEAIASAYHANGTFNEAVFRLAPGARERSVAAAIDRVLVPFGGYGAHGRSEQPAHRFVDSELGELEVEATVLPVIFLGVAAFLLNIVLARIVTQERTQIATLRALGFGVGPIARHYLALATVTSGLGALVGVGLGIALGTAMTQMYVPFFRFPSLRYAADPAVVALAVAVSIGAGALGALSSVRRVVRLAPAEAMQPATPAAFRAGWLDRTRLLVRVPASIRLLIRNVLSRPLRTASAATGIAAAMAILVVGAFWGDALDAMLVHQFERVQREDATVVFTRPMNERAVREIGHVPGVRLAEGIRAVPVRMSAGAREKRVELLGLPAGSTLHRLVDAEGAPVVLPPDGVLLSRHLAERLGLGAGGRVDIAVLEGRRARREVAVAAVVEELLGMGAYIDIDALGRLLGEAPTASAALVAAQPGEMSAVHQAVRSLSGVSTVTVKATTVRRFEETMAQIVLVFAVLLTVFGALVVSGVVYNSARILVAERSRDVATLRVLGFSETVLARLVLLELAVQVAAGLPLGAALGYGLAATAVRLFGPEDMSIPLVVGPGTWALAVAVVLAAATAAALAVRRRLARIDLVEVLKVRE